MLTCTCGNHYRSKAYHTFPTNATPRPPTAAMISATAGMNPRFLTPPDVELDDVGVDPAALLFSDVDGDTTVVVPAAPKTLTYPISKYALS